MALLKWSLPQAAFAILAIGLTVALLKRGASDRHERQSAPTSENEPPKTVPPSVAPPGHDAGSPTTARRPPAVAGELRAELDHAFQAALRLTSPDERRRALRSLADRLADLGDVTTASDFLAAMLRPDDRTSHSDAYTFTKIFADRAAARDPAAIAAWARALPQALQEVAYPFVARHWADRDLSAASAWAKSIDSDALRATVIRATAQQLRTLDAGAAEHWARALAGSADGPRFSDVVAEHWGRRDFHAAAAWSAKLPSSEERESALLSLATVGGERVPTHALAWAETLPEGDLRLQVFHNALSAWAQNDPLAAATWCDAHPRQQQLITRVAPQIASIWMQRDATAAMAWLNRTPVPAETKAYLMNLAAPDRRAAP